MNDLKIYCHNREDQMSVVDFLENKYHDIKICTWEPDGDDENPGTWGMFVDDFPPVLFDEIVDFLESEHSWVLEENVELELENYDRGVFRSYTLS